MVRAVYGGQYLGEHLCVYVLFEVLIYNSDTHDGIDTISELI